MHIRSLMPLGLALFAATGCQSYFPYGYGNSAPYPPMSGTYSPAAPAPSRTTPPANLQQGTGQFPTPSSGQTNPPAGQSRAQSPKSQPPVPKYPDAGGAPASLGAPASEDEDSDPVRRGTSSHENPPRRIDDAGEESEESLSSLGEDRFVSPVSASTAEPEMRRTVSKPRSSPFKKDPNGYHWLRGVVTRDAKTNSWRLTYSRSPLDNDPYGGSLTLVDDEMLDTLMDDDVVYVEGQIDRAVLDQYAKPSYRVTNVVPLKEKDP